MKRIDYDTDVVKHYVRHDGWLKAVRERKDLVNAAITNGARSQALSYFTFCASSAIDVFMLEKANLLRRDRKTGRLKHVYFCEADEEEYYKIASMIGSEEAGFMELFEDFVLFQDDRHTRGRMQPDEEEEVPSEQVRRKLSCKRMHHKFLELHPFDVINLDLYGNLFPPNGDVISRMFETIEKVFDWQQRASCVDDHKIDGFTLFLTIYIHKDDMHRGVIEQLVSTARDNMSHGELEAAFRERYSHNDPDQLMGADFPVFFSIILPKVIAALAKDHGWFGSHRQIYLYGRKGKEDKNYHMMNSVVSYERLPQKKNLPGPKRHAAFLQRYIPEMATVFREMPVSVDAILQQQGTALVTRIEEHLAQIVSFRNNRIASRGE